MRLNSTEEMAEGPSHERGATFCYRLECIPEGKLKSRIYVKFNSCLQRPTASWGSHSLSLASSNIRHSLNIFKVKLICPNWNNRIELY